MTPPDPRQKEAVADPSAGALPATAPAGPETAAPQRAVTLAAPTAVELAAAREIAAAARPQVATSAATAPRPAIESKLARAADPAEMLRVMDLEVALYRARRLSGANDKQRGMFRVLSVFMFIGLVIAVIGAMWYLQTLRDGHARVGQPPAAAAGN